MCIETAINAWLNKINRAINTIKEKEINHSTSLINTKKLLDQ